MDVELHQLRYFVAVADQRHFTKAARELSVAQPSVSKQIRRLEDELGAPLFHRMRGHVALTPAGAAGARWCRARGERGPGSHRDGRRASVGRRDAEPLDDTRAGGAGALPPE